MTTRTTAITYVATAALIASTSLTPAFSQTVNNTSSSGVTNTTASSNTLGSGSAVTGSGAAPNGTGGANVSNGTATSGSTTIGNNTIPNNTTTGTGSNTIGNSASNNTTTNNTTTVASNQSRAVNPQPAIPINTTANASNQNTLTGTSSTGTTANNATGTSGITPINTTNGTRAGTGTTSASNTTGTNTTTGAGATTGTPRLASVIQQLGVQQTRVENAFNAGQITSGQLAFDRNQLSNIAQQINSNSAGGGDLSAQQRRDLSSMLSANKLTLSAQRHADSFDSVSSTSAGAGTLGTVPPITGFSTNTATNGTATGTVSGNATRAGNTTLAANNTGTNTASTPRLTSLAQRLQSQQNGIVDAFNTGRITANQARFDQNVNAGIVQQLNTTIPSLNGGDLTSSQRNQLAKQISANNLRLTTQKRVDNFSTLGTGAGATATAANTGTSLRSTGGTTTTVNRAPVTTSNLARTSTTGTSLRSTGGTTATTANRSPAITPNLARNSTTGTGSNTATNAGISTRTNRSVTAANGTTAATTAVTTNRVVQVRPSTTVSAENGPRRPNSFLLRNNQQVAARGGR